MPPRLPPPAEAAAQGRTRIEPRSGPEAAGGTVYGFGPKDSGSLVQLVFDFNQGDYFDFAVTDGGDGYTYDMTALDAQIEVEAAATTTPEPATGALVGAGVLALGAAARRRRTRASRPRSGRGAREAQSVTRTSA